jgi:hypothetical protein
MDHVWDNGNGIVAASWGGVGASRACAPFSLFLFFAFLFFLCLCALFAPRLVWMERWLANTASTGVLQHLVLRRSIGNSGRDHHLAAAPRDGIEN